MASTNSTVSVIQRRVRETETKRGSKELEIILEGKREREERER